jgi:type IV secretion system protein VirD4
MHERFDNERYRYGSAALSTEEMIAAAGGFDYTHESLFTGFIGNRPLLYNGHAGVILSAGPRQGKMTCWAAYNLCLGASRHNRIIVDIKAEAYGLSNLLAPENRYVFAWNPSRIPGVPYHRINPTDYIHIDSPTLIEDVIAFCEMSCALSGAPQARFFELRSRYFCQNIILALVEMDGVLMLHRLHWAIGLFVTGGEQWLDMLAFPMSSSRFEEVRLCEEEIATLRSREGGGFDGICGELSKNFASLSSPQLRESVSPPYDFSMHWMCQPDQLYALYLCPKGEYVRQWSLVLKSMFLAAKTYRAAAHSAPRQIWLIDEAAQVVDSGAQFILDAYTIGAGAWGVTPITIWQSTYQMRALHKDAENILTASAGLQVYFGMRDFQSASNLSRRIGLETLEYNDEAAQSKARQSYNEALLDVLDGGDVLTSGLELHHHDRASRIRSKQQRHVRTADEILTMPQDKMYVFMDGVHGAIYADRIPYFQVPWMAGRYLGNPYHPPSDQVTIATANGSQIRRVVTEKVPYKYSHFPQHRDSGEWSYVEGFRPCL